MRKYCTREKCSCRSHVMSLEPELDPPTTDQLRGNSWTGMWRSGVDFIHIFCQTLIVKKITYGYELSFPVRKICYGLQLHPDPDPTERKKRVWVHLKLPAPIAAVQCSAGNGSEYCTVARDPALWSSVPLCITNNIRMWKHISIHFAFSISNQNLIYNLWDCMAR